MASIARRAPGRGRSCCCRTGTRARRTSFETDAAAGRPLAHPRTGLPGAGYSATPDGFDYSFDGYADFLDGFVKTLGVDRFALYLHDFGSPIGARLAIEAPQRVVALVIQNGDIPYEDALGPKYADLEKTWTLPPSDMREALARSVSEATFEEEFLNDVGGDIAGASHLRDLPQAELHLLDGGHWLLETHLDEVVAPMREFLGRVHPS